MEYNNSLNIMMASRRIYTGKSETHLMKIFEVAVPPVLPL